MEFKIFAEKRNGKIYYEFYNEGTPKYRSPLFTTNLESWPDRAIDWGWNHSKRELEMELGEEVTLDRWLPEDLKPAKPWQTIFTEAMANGERRIRNSERTSESSDGRDERQS